MASLLRRDYSVPLVCLAAAVCGTAGCSGRGTASTAPATASQSSPSGLVTEQVTDGRFTVVLSDQALQQARAAGINLSDLIARALSHVNALLPGPKTTITVSYAPPADLIPQTGTSGVTDFTGFITAAFGPTPHISIKEALTFWFPRDLAHEVNHSVRQIGGPGVGTTLLTQIITEGIATEFDQAAFTGPLDPWADAITQTQECALWKKAQPQLDYPSSYSPGGLYDLWMFGGPGIPHWTAFTIGYHIVTDYRSRHPNVGWAALTATSAATILAGSHYQPCPP
jgi:uncharacterized protein YjaZ